MKPGSETPTAEARVLALADELFAALAAAFPVCCTSDEFYFFPQALAEAPGWQRWDDFSSDRIVDTVTLLERCLGHLELLPQGHLPGYDPLQVDIALLNHCCGTLREQLTLVQPHCRQPTFHLTVVVAGLAAAMQSGDPAALSAPLAGLPDFLLRAERCLEDVPELFLELGVAMAADLTSWLSSLCPAPDGLQAACLALDRFAAALSDLEPTADFRLTPELLKRVAAVHMRTGLPVAELQAMVDLEIAEMTAVANREARRLGLGATWQEALPALPPLPLPPGGLVELCRREVERLVGQLRDAGLLAGEDVTPAPLEVAPVPPCLQAVRAAAAYSATPGYPPKGGVFYVFEGEFEARSQGAPPEVRFTAAHETLPGHHLLDVARWANSRAVRRPLEHPLFYEGWACFAEQTALALGTLDQDWDPLILATRRLRRACRARLDLGLQTGAMDLAQAAELLRANGYPRARAAAVARKYALRPAYQICYTAGQRRFNELFDRCGGGDHARFSRRVLQHGEIPFDELEAALTVEPSANRDF